MQAFSPAELRDIFTLKLTTDGCQTRELTDISILVSADMLDDLLQCACHIKGKGLSERPENVPSPDKDGNDSDSDDEGIKGFQNASQYDPAPVSFLI